MNTIRLQQNRMNPLVLPVILAKELGIFDNYQVSVDLTLSDDFVFNGKKAFLENQVDAIMGDTTFYFYYQNEGKEAMITSTLTRTIQLVGVTNWQDLPELTVGINRTGLFRFFVDTYLNTLLPPTSYHFINNTYERMAALENGDIQALVAIEPFITQVLSQENTEIIWHSNEIDACFVMWCFDKRFIERFPQTVKNFHLALEDAAHYFNSKTNQEKISLIAQHCKLDHKKAKTYESFVFEPQQNYSVHDFNLCQNWMLNTLEITKKTTSDEGIFKTFSH